MTNDTVVFEGMLFDPMTGEKEWIDASSYVDLELARKFPHPLAV